MYRPAKLKLTKAEKEAYLTVLKRELRAHVVLIFIRLDPFKHPQDWIILAHDQTGRSVVNLSLPIASALDRQCGDRRFLRGWAFDSPGTITDALNKLLDVKLFSRVE